MPPWHSSGDCLAGLTMPVFDNLAKLNVWTGSAELTIADVRRERLSLLSPLCVGQGFRLSMSYAVNYLRIVKGYTE
jgi:hypothetical protein